MLVFPMTKVSTDTISKSENRRLNPEPSILKAGIFNYNYGKEYESWLNDHFRNRDKIFSWNNRVERFLRGTPEAENVKAMEGKEQWLFYKGDNSIANYQNLNNFTEQELANLQQRLEEKRDFCRSLGAEYYVFIAPDKNKVYGEYYPDNYKIVNKIGRGTQVYQYLKQNSDLKIVYPLEAILQAKSTSGKELYYRGDTHWNDLGAYYGYRELLRTMQKDYPQLKPLSEDDLLIEERPHGGDLVGMLGLKRTYPSNYVKFKYPTGVSQKEYQEKQGITKDKGRAIIETDTKQPYRVIVFRDSFASALIPFMAQHFGHAEYFWTRSFEKNKAYVEAYKPDIVIEECVERGIQGLVQ